MSDYLKGIYNIFGSGHSSAHGLLSLADNELLKMSNELNTIFNGEFNIIQGSFMCTFLWNDQPITFKGVKR